MIPDAPKNKTQVLQEGFPQKLKKPILFTILSWNDLPNKLLVTHFHRQ